MSKLRCHISISLDGFVAGPNQSQENPLGEGGERLHDWVVPLAAWRRSHGEQGGEVNQSARIVEESRENIGAAVMGRNMFGPAVSTSPREDLPDKEALAVWPDCSACHLFTASTRRGSVSAVDATYLAPRVQGRRDGVAARLALLPSSRRRSRRSAGRTGTRLRAGKPDPEMSRPRCRTAARPIRRARSTAAVLFRPAESLHHAVDGDHRGTSELS